MSAKSIIFLGTGSDVGKSILATAFCRILRRRGFDAAPFKAQNMSNNSFVTLEGGEIGRAQAVQAEAAGCAPSVHMNPILLKPAGGGVQLVVQGRVVSNLRAQEYYRRKEALVERVMESYRLIAARHEVVVLEGAGSCAELNLRAGDLVNYDMARRAGAKAVLVADIDRGGVFAQVLGTMALIQPWERELTAGFVINKFRGDLALFAEGRRMIEEMGGRPVFGVTPHFEGIRILAEDSVAVQPDRRGALPLTSKGLNLAVVRLPGLSNFTDLEAFELEPDTVVNYLCRPGELTAGYDLVILPGTKNVMEDAAWLGRTGWRQRILNFYTAGGRVLGLCGGFQLLGRQIADPLGVESGRARARGLGLLPVLTTLHEEKILRHAAGRDLRNGRRVAGYEIHMGRTAPMPRARGLRPLLRLKAEGGKETWEDGFASEDGRAMGTYLHGLADRPGWRNEFLNRLRAGKGLAEKSRAARIKGGRDREYDRLADHFEKHLDVRGVLSAMGL